MPPPLRRQYKLSDPKILQNFGNPLLSYPFHTYKQISISGMVLRTSTSREFDMSGLNTKSSLESVMLAGVL